MRATGEIEKELAGLKEQVAELDQRALALRAERDGIDSRNPKRAVQRLGEIANELTAIEQILPSVGRQIDALRAELLQAREGEAEKALTAIRPRERAAVERIVDLVGQLKVALDEMQGLRAEIMHWHGMEMGKVPGGLAEAVSGTINAWAAFGVWHGEGSMDRPAEVLPNPRAKERPDPDKRISQKELDRAAEARERRRSGTSDPDKLTAAWLRALAGK